MNNIFNELKLLQKNCHAPYSKYKVTAIVIGDDEKKYNGVNIENASYGVGTCAERTAIGNAISAGCKAIKEVHLLGGCEKTFGSPCGACRQFMAEFMSDDGMIFIYNMEGQCVSYKLSEILPNCFRQVDLTKE